MDVSAISGPGVYFDGVTSARQDVVVALSAGALRILTLDGRFLSEWPYNEIEQLSAPESLLRLGRIQSNALERLEIADPAFAAEIDRYSAYVDRTGGLQRRERLRVVGWSLGAMTALIAVAFFG